jgi:DNA-directed RNA polymerase subunit RPC12/RpoP
MVNCPRCDGELREPQAVNALSRVDNKTYICSECGTREALFNYRHPDTLLPPVNEPVWG